MRVTLPVTSPDYTSPATYLATMPVINPAPSAYPPIVDTSATRKRDPRYFVPGTTSRLLSTPDKMPGYAFGTPAPVACPFRADSETMAKFINLITDPIKRQEYEDSLVCNICYAQKGKYTLPDVKRAQQRRYDFIIRSLKENQGAEFVHHMITAIKKYCVGSYAWFRIHDSGDFFSPAYAELWIQIVRACPEVMFWAPTRSYRGPKILAVLIRLHAEVNVNIAPSGLTINGAAPVIPGLSEGSTVTTDHAAATCRAIDHDGHCGTCRACWFGGASYSNH